MDFNVKSLLFLIKLNKFFVRSVPNFLFINLKNTCPYEFTTAKVTDPLTFRF